MKTIEIPSKEELSAGFEKWISSLDELSAFIKNIESILTQIIFDRMYGMSGDLSIKINNRIWIIVRGSKGCILYDRDHPTPVGGMKISDRFERAEDLSLLGKQLSDPVFVQELFLKIP